MGQTNALITKFRIAIDGLETFGSDIVSVGGLSLGKEGSVEVPEWDKVALVSDGVKKYDPLNIKFRLMEGMETFAYFHTWWKERATRNKEIAVIETRRDFTELFRWVFTDVEFSDFSSPEDLEMGAIKVKQMECVFLPYEVDMIVFEG